MKQNVLKLALVSSFFISVAAVVSCSQQKPATPAPTNTVSSSDRPVPQDSAVKNPEPLVSAPLASSAKIPPALPPVVLPDDASVILWTFRVPDQYSTYWVSPRDGKVLGKSSGLFIVEGSNIWEWKTAVTKYRIHCPSMQDRFSTTGTDLSSWIEKLGSKQQISIRVGNSKTLFCQAIMDAAVIPRGSIGSTIFIDRYFYDYSGGAHGISITDAMILDLSNGQQVSGWEKELLPSTSDLERIKKDMGDGMKDIETNDNLPGWVTLEPYSVRPVYIVDATLRLEICMSAETNIAQYNMVTS